MREVKDQFAIQNSEFAISRSEAAVIGVSAGGMKALSVVLPELPEDFGLAVIVVQHIAEGSGNYLVTHLGRLCKIRVKEADEKEIVLPGTVYVAASGYHLLVEDDRTFSLSADPPVNHARPSIDVLFESAAEVLEDKLAGIILTGANSDGAQGLAAVKAAGGLAVVQDPETAESPMMPRAAIEAAQVDHVLTLPQIASFLCDLDRTKGVREPNPAPEGT